MQTETLRDRDTKQKPVPHGIPENLFDGEDVCMNGEQQERNTDEKETGNL